MELCLHCDEPVLAGEASEARMVIGAVSGWRWLHLACAARMALGSVGHQRGKCSCYGGTEEDPPGMTKRQAAIAAYAWARLRPQR